MSITSVDDIVAGLASAQDIDFYKTLNAAPVAGGFFSAWFSAGFPAAGSTPPVYTAGSGYTCSRTTTGALRLTNGAVQLWLARLAASCTQPGTIILFDRLWACSFTAPTTFPTTLTVTTPGNLPARITDNGVDVELWLEVSGAAGGASSGTQTFNYLDTTGAAQSTTVTLLSAPARDRLQPIPLAAGVLGVKQVTSFVNNTATMTSGNYNIVLMKPVARIPILGAGLGEVQDWAKTGLPKIPNDACLFAIFLAQNTTIPTIIGTLDLIDK